MWHSPRFCQSVFHELWDFPTGHYNPRYIPGTDSVEWIGFVSMGTDFNYLLSFDKMEIRPRDPRKKWQIEIWIRTQMFSWNAILGVILGIGLASERRHYMLTPPLIGWALTQPEWPQHMWMAMFVPRPQYPSMNQSCSSFYNVCSASGGSFWDRPPGCACLFWIQSRRGLDCSTSLPRGGLDLSQQSPNRRKVGLWNSLVVGRRYVTLAKWVTEVGHWPPSSLGNFSCSANCVFDNYIYTRYIKAQITWIGVLVHIPTFVIWT